MSYRRPMHCQKCEDVIDHSVMKKKAYCENGKQKVVIHKICARCRSDRESIISALSWVCLIRNKYWGEKYWGDDDED